MKKKFGCSILCVMALSMCVCAGCGKEGNSGAAGADNPNTAGTDNANTAGTDNSYAAGTDNSDEGMTEGSGTAEEIHLEFDPDTKTMLTWMAPYGVANSDDDVYIEFNNLLHRKGYDFYVNFYTPGIMVEEYTQLIHDVAASGQEIDIFSTGYDYYGGLYSDLARDGLCQELNAYLESAGGKALYDAKDELVWKSLSVEGKIYGLSVNHIVSASFPERYYYVNQDIAQKYGIDCDRLFEDDSYFFDSILTVEEGERADGDFEPYLTNSLFNWPEDMLKIVNSPVAIRVDSDGKYQAVNVYEDQRVHQAIITYRKLGERGHKIAEYTQAQIDAGKYFIINSLTPVECGNALEIIRPLFIDVDGNSSGGVICIAEWSRNKDAAFELLSAVHTDRELSETLAFGIEGIHYRVEDDKIVKTDVEYAGRWSTSLLANMQLLRWPNYEYASEIAFMEENREALLANPLFGNPLDYRRVKKQLLELQECVSYSFPNGVSSWYGQDFEQKYEEGLQNLRDAGIDEVLEEFNRQLQERGLQ